MPCLYRKTQVEWVMKNVRWASPIIGVVLNICTKNKKIISHGGHGARGEDQDQKILIVVV
ncbi:MAG: hypothetical protein JKY19_09340 [Alcanivoracaceae bacterium]|nr:hypothetical protein [Alcanivoracaceae bacterium]